MGRKGAGKRVEGKADTTNDSSCTGSDNLRVIALLILCLYYVSSHRPARYEHYERYEVALTAKARVIVEADVRDGNLSQWMIGNQIAGNLMLVIGHDGDSSILHPIHRHLISTLSLSFRALRLRATHCIHEFLHK